MVTQHINETTILKIPSTRIRVPRWGSKPPGAATEVGGEISLMGVMGCVERGDD